MYKPARRADSALSSNVRLIMKNYSIEQASHKSASSPEVTRNVDLAEAFRCAMRILPGRAAVISTEAGGVARGCSVSSFLTLSLDPPSVLVSLSEHSQTLAQIEFAKKYALNILDSAETRILENFSKQPSEERFNNVDYHWLDGVPVLADSRVALSCELSATTHIYDHVLVVGEIVSVT